MSHDDRSARSARRAVETLSAFGVRHVFGVPGAKIDELYDALLDGDPQLVVCRHEQNAAFMAAAVGRLTGVPGCALVTSGPGTTNLVTGLLTANTEQFPMLAICGAVARRDRLKRTHQTMDAAAALRPVTKYVGEIDDPDDVTEAIANALRAAVTEPRGAAAVILPMDVAAAPTGARIGGPMPVPSLGPAPRDRIRRAVELIRDAERPVVLAGLRSATPDACAALRELLAGTDLPVVETFQAAGVVSRKLEDHFVGRVGLFSNQPGDVLMAHADLLVTVGYDPVEYDPGLWNPDPARAVVHVDTLNADIDNHYQPAIELRGDIAATLTEMAGALAGLRMGEQARAAIAAQRRALAEIDERAKAAPATELGLNPAAVILKIRELVDDDATVVADVGSNYIYTARHFRSYEPGHLLFSNGQQTLGVALPWAMAAALLRPATQVVSISGDGGFLFTAQELETATRLGLRLTHVILRDDTYDMVAFQEKLKYGRTSGVRLGDYDVVQYAGAFGARGIRVSTMEAFETELRDALEAPTTPGVTVIDVRVDYSHNTDLFAHLHDGVLT
ncbi:acetolactate synthase AlsS [Herbidospora cretacea]|uniref:acetolactate synthase AlsS n=1 Tax=Herbidospora cretacea TaxID=28444 RepID=UPI0004C30A00|nr:acetolactate synthase AlsS [Herbidospora cretacea]